MTSRAPTPPLPLWLTAACWVLAFALVMTVTFIITTANSDAEQRDFAQRSGTIAVPLSGQLESDDVLITTASLITSAELETTTIEMSVTRKSGSSGSSPIIRVEFDDLVCQTGRSWLWSHETSNTLPLRCDRFISKQELETVGTGSVQISR